MIKLKKVIELGIGHWVLSKVKGGPYRTQSGNQKIKIINMSFEGPKKDTKKFLTLTNLSFS